jgi:hypothetical protein
MHLWQKGQRQNTRPTAVSAIIPTQQRTSQHPEPAETCLKAVQWNETGPRLNFHNLSSRVLGKSKLSPTMSATIVAARRKIAMTTIALGLCRSRLGAALIGRQAPQPVQQVPAARRQEPPTMNRHHQALFHWKPYKARGAWRCGSFRGSSLRFAA